MKRFLAVLACFLVIVGIVSSMGCETWHGFGKDIQNAGKAIEGKK